MVTWDDKKRRDNITKHGFDFVGSEVVFQGFTITREDCRDEYGEQRLQTLGLWGDIVVFIEFSQGNPRFQSREELRRCAKRTPDYTQG